MTTASKIPGQIRAHVHENAIQRVTRFYDASTSQCLHEVLQNSRRAGASRVDITIKGEILSIQDNGSGVKDPQALLGFGHSDWNSDISSQEDPAGMGIYSLSRRQNVSIASHCAESGAAWQVDLEEDHFVGARPADVIRLDAAQTPAGTRVSFASGQDARRAIREAVRYYPLPVTVNGEPMDQEDFLAKMQYVEEWEGLRIGVNSGRDYRHSHAVNFHGLTIMGGKVTETVRSKGNIWHASIDVIDCPQLELTLPARQEVVDSPFNREVKTACRRAIYRAMLASGEHVQVSRRVFEEANSMGIALPEAKPLLYRWQPETADSSATPQGSNRQEDPLDVSSPQGFSLMAADLDPPAGHSLQRGISLTQPQWTLLEPDRDYAGYQWYDQLSLVTEINTAATTTGGASAEIPMRSTEVKTVGDRVDSITIRLNVTDRQPAAQRDLEVETDVAFWTEEYGPMDDADVILTEDTNLTVEELSQMLMDAFFRSSDDKDADSFETQQDYAETESLSMARRYLQSKTEALRQILTTQAHRHLRYEIPDGWTAVITIQPPNGITVALTEAAPAEETPAQE